VRLLAFTSSLTWNGYNRAIRSDCPDGDEKWLSLMERQTQQGIEKRLETEEKTKYPSIVAD